MSQVRSRIKELRYVQASTLIPHGLNYRKHPERQKRLLTQLFGEIGYADALLARTTSTGQLQLIDGHLRAETTPDQEVPVLVLDVTEAEANKLLLTLDPLAGLAETDAGLLGQLLDATDATGDLAAWLSERAEESGIIDAPPTGAADNPPTEDQAEKLLKKWKVAQGDLWNIGRHRLLCGDSRSAVDVARLLNGEEINVAFTSPPYASQRKYDESSGFKPIPPDEYVNWFEAVQDNVKAHLAPDGSWFVNIKEAADNGTKQSYVKRLCLSHIDSWSWLWIEEYCWLRPAMPMDPNSAHRFKNGWESIYHFASSIAYKFKPDEVRHESDGCFVYKDQKAAGRKICDGAQGVGGGIMSPSEYHSGLAFPSNVLNIQRGANVVGHSAAFPISLPTFFIKAFSDPGDLIYEPFAGSGTTLVAAEKEGRRCAAVEISPKYCALILERWALLTGQTPTLAADP